MGAVCAMLPPVGTVCVSVVGISCRASLSVAHAFGDDQGDVVRLGHRGRIARVGSRSITALQFEQDLV